MRQVANKFTHLAYAFAAVAPNFTVVNSVPYSNASTYHQFDALTRAHNITRIVSVGGAGGLDMSRLESKGAVFGGRRGMVQGYCNMKGYTLR